MAQATAPTPTLRLQLRLLRAPDDSAVFGADYQTELRQFKQQLEVTGLAVSPTFATVDRAGAVKGLTGQFLLSWVPAIGLPLKTLGEIAMAWINGRAGRTLRLTVGDVELEAHSKVDIERLVEQVIALKALLVEPDARR
ncbi:MULTISPECIES: hypothetical protein [Pseudomonas]|uniref:hypothetical protein n=1 Tax=unclassified Pseudomonas TaxID=196821 RepID=UPI001F38917A|nr:MULTISPECIES: hypothetical protein [unclassified Pseudomonas]MCF5507466.1 hypothetical protein [Pseudomonas sp. PA-3-6H]MCF5517217.1 hypothetical protein [Pseudomonas sp. PA-3-6E]MCF5564168.1 hypothetical protein [Pseudomonas sp. PA-3-5D]MCF5566489.1 hypothetical protein [Pseudomonas sp. PA-3-11C]MCF5592130.1 hypothetical protein [Pseudomonas sp. PA-3-10C]